MVESDVLAATTVTPERARGDQCVSSMGYRVYDDDLSLIPLSRPCSTVQTISPISYGTALRDRLHREAMQQADWLCLDGVYFGLSSIVLQGKGIRRNQGPDIFAHFMARLQKQKGRAFFLGATPETLEKIRARASKDYPDVAVGTYAPPFKPEFSQDDNDAMVAAINVFSPDVVFLGMTAPKQEKWGHLHKARLDACLVVAIGGVFDWYAGNRKEIAPIWWRLRLAWLIRTIERPELLKRYPLIGRFAWHVLLARLGIRKHPSLSAPPAALATAPSRSAVSSSSPLRVGIIGMGRMGVTHYSIINSRADVAVVATAEPSPLVNKLLGKYARVATFKGYREMLSDAELDAVLVCTPPAANVEILNAVADRGLHAFVEKPFTLSADDANALSARFENADLINQVGYVNRFNDVFAKTKAMALDGLIGRVRKFRSEMYSGTIVRAQDEGGWRSAHANGGGAIYEMATHAVDLINFLFGKPDLVRGTALTSIYSKAVEDVVSSTFLYRDGLSGSLYVNWSDASLRKPTNKLELFGDNGKILADQHGIKVFLKAPNAKWDLREGWNQLYITDVFSNVPFYLRGIEFTAQLYDFVDCIRDRRSARCSFADAADTLWVIDAMFADWQTTKRELAG